MNRTELGVYKKQAPCVPPSQPPKVVAVPEMKHGRVAKARVDAAVGREEAVRAAIHAGAAGRRPRGRAAEGSAGAREAVRLVDTPPCATTTRGGREFGRVARKSCISKWQTLQLRGNTDAHCARRRPRSAKRRQPLSWPRSAAANLFPQNGRAPRKRDAAPQNRRRPTSPLQLDQKCGRARTDTGATVIASHGAVETASGRMDGAIKELQDEAVLCLGRENAQRQERKKECCHFFEGAAVEDDRGGSKTRSAARFLRSHLSWCAEKILKSGLEPPQVATPTYPLPTFKVLLNRH